MIPWVFWTSALLLALERVAYAGIFHRPEAFERISRHLAPQRDPVTIVEWLFAAFKILQALVFGGWCVAHGGAGSGPVPGDVVGPIVGWPLIISGQALNASVFARLGRVGVFYGSRLNREVPWCSGFPFTWFRHPQYVGTTLSIWGLFLVLRYPAADWLALPALETVYYALGAWVERTPEASAFRPDRAPRATSPGPSSSGRPR